MVELSYIYHGKVTMLNDQETVYETENVNKPLRQAKLWNSHSRYRQLQGWAGDKHHHLIRISYKAQWSKSHLWAGRMPARAAQLTLMNTYYKPTQSEAL